MTAIRLVLTALSFVLYATTVMVLHQTQTVAFMNEENGPLPAAVSHWLYGTPGGLIDPDVMDRFKAAMDARVPAAEAVYQALHGAISATDTPSVAMDGAGVGLIVVARLGFALFGPHAGVLPLIYLLLIGLSTASFALRYRDERMSAAPIYLLALTLLLFAPPLARGAAAQAPIGGLRYYAVVGILPTLHWCLEFGDAGIPGRHGGLLRWGLLGIQLAVMGLAILVRGSPFYLLLPLAGSVWLALRRRHAGVAVRATATYLIVPAAVLTICLGPILRFAFPDYAATGRLYVNVWHHAFLGLSDNPNFPFPGLSEAYPCPDIPDGLGFHNSDDNGECIWWNHVRADNMSPDDGAAEIYSGEYERALRNAVVYVVLHYPGEVLKNFLVYKPSTVVHMVEVTWPSLSSPLANRLLPLALMQLVLFIGFVAVRPSPRPFHDAAVRLAVLLPFVISVQVPLFIAWPAPHTILDLLVFLLCGVATGLWLVLDLCFNLIWETELRDKVRSGFGKIGRARACVQRALIARRNGRT